MLIIHVVTYYTTFFMSMFSYSLIFPFNVQNLVIKSLFKLSISTSYNSSSVSVIYTQSKDKERVKLDNKMKILFLFYFPKYIL